MRAARLPGRSRFLPAATLAAWVAGAIFTSLTSPAAACSMCRCGDPTFNALGTDVYVAGRFRLAVDWDRFEKESAGDVLDRARTPAARWRGEARGDDGGGAPSSSSPRAGSVGRDHEVESRFTATLSYSFGETVTAVARLPWSARRLTTADPAGGTDTTIRASGMADPELYALVRVWAAPFAAGVGRRAWLSLLGGVKSPWGGNDVSDDGVRLDEHVQPGTGSTDLVGGASFVFLVDPGSSLFASAQVRRAGSNRFGYRYGDAVLANLAYERKLAELLDGVLELNYRHAARDRIDASGQRDPNTGGGILYVTPRAVVSLGHGLVGRASVQIPLLWNLYGDQTERPVFSAGLTILF